MKLRNRFFLILVLIGALALSGCNIFDWVQPDDPQALLQTSLASTQLAQQEIETIVAATLDAMPMGEPKAPEALTPTDIVAVPTNTTFPTLQPTEAPTSTPTEAPTSTPTDMPMSTPTTAAPLAQVSVPTNCRTGPGIIFDQVNVLNIGRQVEVIARNASGTYWVVRNPGGEGTCWLWDQYATITGNTADLPIWDSPPTPTPTPGMTPTAVTMRVSIPTNCRVGPGIPYEIISVLQANRTVDVLARHATADFWVINNPVGFGTCWVWGEHATFTGSKWDLPVQAAPPAPTQAPGVTPTAVTMRVSIPTNCRVGPGIPYEIVSVLQANRTVDVLARHATADFWVINNPVGSGTCWVWGEHATFTGSKWDLPVQAAPPAPTPTAVTLRVRVDTNCRVGPGIPYDIVTIFRIGKTATVVGRHASLNFWVIENPEGSGTCWVWGEYATLTGPSSSLPIWYPPPKP
ncbi:MAG TPA: PT domain-containing protein [Brevefilum sp.]|nr:PT domain-containing protein [Brevefilum sp.]HOR19663.1 PT domain-containing protein [Brevefilum sp.]HPL70075.1 PT domain-containing protein [Brevefilum sp.]